MGLEAALLLDGEEKVVLDDGDEEGDGQVKPVSDAVEDGEPVLGCCGQEQAAVLLCVGQERGDGQEEGGNEDYSKRS